MQNSLAPRPGFEVSDLMRPLYSVVLLADASLGDALGIALTGMLIVFVALGLITLFLTLLPRLMQQLAVYFPEQEHGHGPHGLSDSDSSDEDELLAAIGFVMHTEFSRDA